jgi:hypothetical protein
MVTRARLQKLSDLKARALVKKTFRRFCVCVALFLSLIIGVIVLKPHRAPDDGDLSVSVLRVLARDYLFLPIRAVPMEPKR